MGEILLGVLASETRATLGRELFCSGVHGPGGGLDWGYEAGRFGGEDTAGACLQDFLGGVPQQDASNAASSDRSEADKVYAVLLNEERDFLPRDTIGNV